MDRNMTKNKYPGEDWSPITSPLITLGQLLDKFSGYDRNIPVSLHYEDSPLGGEAVIKDVQSNDQGLDIVIVRL